jgi:DNA-directed RNA polymerase specialized sigma24 family protein
VAHVQASAQPGEPLSTHLAACALCLEEIEEIRDLLSTSPVEELTQAYQGLEFTLISVPTALVRHLFPKNACELFLDELRRRWAAAPLAEIAWAPARLDFHAELRPGKRPRYYIGQTVTLRLRVDEDCYLTLLHLDPGGQVRPISPDSREASQLHAGAYEFSGTVEGAHDEIHTLIALASRSALRWPGAALLAFTSTPMHALQAQLNGLSRDQYSWSEYQYRVADPSQTSIDDLEESCKLEIADRGDQQKPACGEVSRRTLDISLSDSQRSEAFSVFYKITSRLILRWITLWTDQLPAQGAKDTEAYLQEIYTRLLGSKVQCRGYLLLLGYLKTIATRVLLQEHRALKRQAISALRRKLAGLSPEHGDGTFIQRVVECLTAHGLKDALDCLLLEGLMRGERLTALKDNPLVHAAFDASRSDDLEKFLHNRRDTAVWHAFKAMRRFLPLGEEHPCRRIAHQFLDL